MIASLVSLFVVGVIGLVVVAVALAVVGTIFSVTLGLVGVLLFKVAPILLLGWAIVAIYRRSQGGGRGDVLSAADRRWLERGD